MNPVDQYIRRATTGLPGRTRLDKAAELRVHLNERVTQYTQQGFERAEAEHLAVQHMGPAEPVNRSFLGHVFTPRVGWVVLVLLVLAAASWVGANYLFAPAATAQERQVTADELMGYLGDFASLQLTLPRGTQTIWVASSIGADGPLTAGHRLTERLAALRPNQRLSMPISIGFLNQALARSSCEPGERVLVTQMDSRNRSEGCMPMPSDTGGWVSLMQNDAALVQNAWQPLLLYRPSVVVEELQPGQRSTLDLPDGFRVYASRDTWIVLSVMLSTELLGESDPAAKPPTVAEVVQQFRWLEF